jgi:oxygen-independent coproporphyrinogen III oxidase
MILTPTLGIYVHVPFCARICPYCDFVKTSKFTRQTIDVFFSKVSQQYLEMKPFFVRQPSPVEAQSHQIKLKSEKPKATLYFGGGTPALLPGHLYTDLVSQIKEDFDILEFTVEANPFSLQKSTVQSFLDLGCNRMTLGAQSLCPQTLKFLGRKHTPEQVKSSLELIRSLGAAQMQVQADLIYGLKPGVRSLKVEDEFESFMNHGATGVSCYALSLEARTLFSKTQNANEDVAADEYLQILTRAEKLGVSQIETSNFSLFPALHNEVYWNGLPYMGLGPGAHGLVPPSSREVFGRRYRVGPEKYTELAPGDDDLDLKSTAINSERDAFSLQWEPLRSHDDYSKEMLFTLSRLPKGVSLTWIREHFGAQSVAKLKSDGILQRAVKEQLVYLTDLELKIAPAEKIRGDAWVTHLLKVLEGS